MRPVLWYYWRAGICLGQLWRLLDSHRSRSSQSPVGRSSDTAVIRVQLPFHLQRLADVGREVELQVDGPVTQRTVLDALETRYPMLSGTVRDHITQERRDFIRFFACGEDLSHESPDAPLPDSVANGTARFMIIGALAGG